MHIDPDAYENIEKMHKPRDMPFRICSLLEEMINK